MDKTTQIAIIVSAIVIAISFLIQAVVMISVLIASRRMQKKVQTIADDLRLHVLPAVSASRAMVEDLSPKFKVIVSNFVDTSHNIRSMSSNVGSAVGDVAGRARAQAAQVDEMVDGVLHQVSHAGQAIQHGISVPVKQMSGILNGLRVGIDVLRRGNSRSTTAVDDDLFI